MSVQNRPKPIQAGLKAKLTRVIRKKPGCNSGFFVYTLTVAEIAVLVAQISVQ